MKTHLTLLSLALLSTSASALQAAEITVSPKGAIFSLEAARDAVRELRSEGERGDIDVIIESGVYALDETLIFDSRDSAPKGAVTRYKAAEGASPVISGGRVIDNWEASELQDGNIWTASVPWAKGDAFFHCLYDGSELLQRSQSPGFGANSDGHRKQYAGELEHRIRFTYNGDVLENKENLADLEIYGAPTRGWLRNFLGIASVDSAKKEAVLSVPATYSLFGGFVLENSVDYLDEPGEWAVDSQKGILYYWPKSGNPSNQITAPRLNELIRVEGVNDPSLAGLKDQPVEGIVFEGLTFSYADRQQWLPQDKGIQHDWNMWDKANGLIRFRGAARSAVHDCIFKDSGSDGVRLDLYCQDITVEGSYFTNLGGTGILLSGYGPGKKDVNQNNVIRNNEIVKVGQLFLHSPGIFVWQSGHNLIAHNHIHDLAYTGMVISGVRRRFFDPIFQEMGVKNPFTKWQFEKENREHSSTIRWDEITLDGDINDWNLYEPYMHARGNIIEFNEVHDCLKLLHDGNCIYLSGNGDGNIVRYNVNYNHPKGSLIRTDDDSHGATVYGNLLFGTMVSQGIAIKGLNTATGNVFVNSQLLTGGAGNTVDPDATLSRNVFYFTSRDVSNGFHYGLPKVKEGLDYNLYYHYKPGKAQELLDAQMAASRTKLVDRNSVVADPLFIDPIHGDFGFQPDSPALKLGIEPLPLAIVEKMGTFNDPFIKRFASGMPMHSLNGEHEVKGKKGKRPSELDL
ncbi:MULTISPECIES: right-handed parallel beta-helix repeat-containing protein [unclassified Lentimonas]|uniref:right-handed parallel beta-helix repeat-containing protein n=1 Tax=unclassified Lentimonas TaxID=2630993 RepID=UPI00132254B7|nr:MULTISPECIES: right-handed parallel beta-helix repeat-containing protein [unclassified Lentimonas]CAA6677799.1 Unannotated [Lentimonas sp. CC4]CAA6683901.1 Unannotated [Lentimonas sp. CC6]CAA7076721.1 Unannotated [Lentimonas sp. CC4]CAA7169944.1 Unannotated [Lentimonas sp. CC21]CAA7181233.1 Unannotated [Lentimonas sp. CC8]